MGAALPALTSTSPRSASNAVDGAGDGATAASGFAGCVDGSGGRGCGAHPATNAIATARRIGRMIIRSISMWTAKRVSRAAQARRNTTAGRRSRPHLLTRRARSDDQDALLAQARQGGWAVLARSGCSRARRRRRCGRDARKRGDGATSTEAHRPGACVGDGRGQVRGIAMRTRAGERLLRRRSMRARRPGALSTVAPRMCRRRLQPARCGSDRRVCRTDADRVQQDHAQREHAGGKGSNRHAIE